LIVNNVVSHIEVARSDVELISYETDPTWRSESRCLNETIRSGVKYKSVAQARDKVAVIDVWLLLHDSQLVESTMEP